MCANGPLVVDLVHLTKLVPGDLPDFVEVSRLGLAFLIYSLVHNDLLLDPTTA